jgi:hypothetical protein
VVASDVSRLVAAVQTFTDQIRDAQFADRVVMNWKRRVNLNPNLTAKLLALQTGVVSHITLGEVDDAGSEIVIRPADPKAEGALKLTYSKTGRSASFLMTLVCIKYPVLRVPKGRLRSFPVSIKQFGEQSYLVIDIKSSELANSPTKQKKSGSEPAPAVEPAKQAEAPKSLKVEETAV